MELLDWLQEQPIFPKVYWQSRDKKLKVAGAGSAHTLHEIPDLNMLGKHRFFGGLSFSASGKKEDLWKDFPSCYFFLPAYELEEQDGKVNLINNTDIHLPVFHNHPSYSNKLELLDRSDAPSFEGWEKMLLKALEMIRKGEFEKVVLARRTTFTFRDKINPFYILKILQQQAVSATLFALQISPESAFIGATPEKLYRREEGRIMSEAVAGTRPRGQTEEEDLKLREELLANEKEIREFGSVKDFIFSTLSSLCHSVSAEGKEKVIATSRVQHLYQRFSGQLLSSINDRDLLQALHPTPALGGYPRDKTVKFILDEEPFDRGWYGAPLGWISSEKADMDVGIRSALIEGNHLHLFAGTGIVRGSDPSKEWEELEQKISQFQRIFSDEYSLA